MVKATSADAMPLSDLNPPFVAVEHHKGGHLPYGYSFAEYDTPSFFEEIRPSYKDLPGLYEESVRTAEERFLEAIEHLNNRGVLDETLVIYTSDHGEALGEKKNGGAIGHGDPISPDLVNVPIVFAGAGLSDQSLDTPLSGVDVAPTALSALGRGAHSFDGEDCWTELRTNRYLRSERWVQFDAPMLGTIDSYKASSVWDDSGGIVFHRGSRLGRVALAVGKRHVKAPWSYLNRSSPGQWLALLQKYGRNSIQYGSPDFDEESAASIIKPFRKGNAAGEAEEIDREQLRKLGYLE
jgi:arylsulfatase A-like enzyme